MVKLTGQLLSLAASGTIGKVATFSNWKGRAYAKKYSQPTNNQQLAQLGIRTALTFLSKQWAALAQDEKDSWNDLATADHVSPFDSYMGMNLRRIADGLGISKEFPVTEDANGAANVNQVPQIFPNYFEISSAYTGSPAPWAIAWSWSQTSGFTPDLSNLILYDHAFIFPGFHPYRFDPPNHGTWYVKNQTCNDSGTLGVTSGEIEVIY